MGVQETKNIQVAAATTLGVPSSNSKPVTTERISQPTAKTNFFARSAVDNFILTQNTQQVGLPFSLDLYKTLPKQEKATQPQIQAQAAQAEMPSFKNIGKNICSDFRSALHKINRLNSFSSKAIAEQNFVSRSDIDTAARLPRIQAILYKMNQEWNAPELT